jgi:hypothetical protein
LGFFHFLFHAECEVVSRFVHFALALSNRLPVRVKSDISKDLHSHNSVLSKEKYNGATPCPF